MTTFSDLHLDERVLQVLRRMDIVEPTPIQAAAIPEIMAGRDIVGQARTGSGKTLAFSIPLLSVCDPTLKAPQALILVPTRELAAQVARVVDKLAPAAGLRAAQIYGGRDMDDQIMLLNSGPQIIIGTPGRLLDHLWRGTLSLRHLRYLVLDEADQMLDAGFGPDVDKVFDCAPPGPQIALFSATVPAWVHEVIAHRLDDPAIVKVDEQQRGPTDTVEHTVIEVAQSRKLDALGELLDESDGERVIVFARTKIGVERLEKQLQGMGYEVASLQGNLSQPVRERVLRGFRRGKPSILVATNVAARGLDIQGIGQVINFDVPDSAELLTHRLGRTGRMGRHGTAVTLLSPAEERQWRAIEKQIGIKTHREHWGVQPALSKHALQGSERQDAPATRSTDQRERSRSRGRADRPKTQVVCAQCGQETTVRFTPRDDRPVYCGTCFRERKAATTAA